MLIICPKCTSKFEVDEKLIKKSVRQFECGVCKSRFDVSCTLDQPPVVSAPVQSPVLTEQPQKSVPNENIAELVGAENLSKADADLGWDLPRDTGDGYLPEEFTPVEKPKSKGGSGWLISLILLFLLLGMGAYAWQNRVQILDNFPNLKKGIALITNEQSKPEEDYTQALVPVDPLTVADIVSVEEQTIPDNAPSPTDQLAASARQENEGQEEGEPAVVTVPSVPAKEQHNQSSVQGNADMPLVALDQASQHKQNSVPSATHATVSSNAGDVANLAIEDEPIILEEVPLVPDVPVEIKDVVFRLDDTGTDKTRLFVQGVVANMTDQEIDMPELQAQIYTKDDVVLGVRPLPHTPSKLAPKMAEFFFAEVTDVPNGLIGKVTVVIKGK